MRYIYYSITLCLLLSIVLANPNNAQSKNDISIPHLQKHGSATQLIVNQKPFIILGGELGNSSASDLNYIKPYWDNFKKMNLNTILAPVYWELIEPEEGKFDFSLVDGLIKDARKSNIKLVLLWFGSWKNSMSCYAPYWVKENEDRFPRARTKDGKAVEILTPFNNENRDADAKAFAALMKHIQMIDQKENTVLMIQVENEIGMIPEARDYCDEANKIFNKPVPAELIEYLQTNKESLIPEFYKVWQETGFKTSGTWEEVFGKGLNTDEIFMAWYFGKYTNYVARAGKEEYPLPMYVNAALIRPNYKPGQYPSAGPLPHIMDIWKAAAPDIDFLSPDIYFRNFIEWCQKYDRSGNSLFIPEAGINQGAANAFYAIGQHNAIGYSPFSIESIEDPDNSQISKGYDVLSQLMPLITGNQGKGTMAGVLLDSASQKTQVVLGNYKFNIRHEYSWPYAEKLKGETPRFGCLIIMLSPNEFIIAGSGVVVTFETNKEDNSIAGIGSLDEGKFVNGKWIAGRRMNGDQSHQGRHLDLPGTTYGIQKIKLYTYK